MKYFGFGKKISLLLVWICLVHFGFAAETTYSIEAPLLEKETYKPESQSPAKSALQHGHQESSIDLIRLKYAPLLELIIEADKKQEKILLPSIVVDDVIVMLQDSPHSLYSKTSRPPYERSPG
ncbi:MAG: hypothetical protein HRU41_10275 [Saprospiraceae bacterium]|nr:hypothetical protein [Saprospiraceae bacterium]